MRLRLKKNVRNHLDNVSNNYKILGTSWSVQTKVFFENSTLHGVRYIAETGRPFVERFMWFVCVAIGTVATIIIIISLWEKFQTNPTITGLDTDFHNWEVAFPAITVCQETPSNMSIIEEFIESSPQNAQEGQEIKSFFQALTQLSYNTIGSFKKYTKFKFIPEKSSIKDTVFTLMNKCEDIFEECTWKSKPYNCCDGFFPVFTEIGFCYSFNSRHYERKYPGRVEDLPTFDMQYIKETDVKWALSFRVKDSNVQMPIYILNSDEQAGVDVQLQHLWDFRVKSISFSVKQTYTTSDTKQLSIKQRHCVFPDEIKLKTDHLYTYTACTRQCRMDTAMKRCGCVPHFYPSTDNYRHCSVSELSCIADNLNEIVSADKCSCQLGCSNTVYEVEKLNQNDGEDITIMETEFMSWPMVRYKREVLFGWVDLLVSFGGIAGLFLGFSLLSGVEIIYYFTIRAFCMVVRERETLEKMQLEKAAKPLPQYDLGLVPYFISDPLPGNGITEMRKRYAKNARYGYDNRIVPLKGNWKTTDTLISPFGIEFVN